jgi:predicted transposase YbfD/YdcC
MKTTSLTVAFEDMPDPRSRHGRRYPLDAIITIAFCAALSGAEDWVAIAAYGRAKAEWFGTFLDLPDGTPSHDTFDRVFSRLDPDAFERCFRLWASTLAGPGGLVGTISLDGKTLRRSFDTAASSAAIHMVSAWACEHNLVFGQIAVDDKSNEITAIPKLLELLDIKGCVVTIDAMGCQKQIAENIVKKGGEYVLAVKDNQPTLRQGVNTAFDRGETEGWSGRVGIVHDTHEEIDKGHGRIERRVTSITWDRRDLIEAMGWPGVRALVRVKRERTIDQTTSTTIHQYITNMETRRADRVAAAVRSHWEVENRLHWSLDVSFDEDRSRLRKGHGAQNMSRLRRLALNALRADQSQKLGIKNKRLLAGWDHKYLLRLLAFKDG